MSQRVANTTGDPQKLAISRLRRIATGEEVAFTPESVQELAGFSSTVTVPQHDMHKDPELGDGIAQIIKTGIADLPVMFQPFLPERHKSPTISSGLTYGLRYGSIGGLDPFSILPEVASEPVPKQLLIRYCRSELEAFHGKVLTNPRYREAGTLDGLP
jgi:hypothetical protein